MEIRRKSGGVAVLVPFARRLALVSAVIAVSTGLSLPAAQSGALGPPGRSDLARASLSSPLHRIAVFGPDDRVLLPADRAALGNSIGLLLEPRSRSVCTAFCVGDDVIATAGHCLFRTAGQRPPKLKNFQFRLQPQNGPGATARIAGIERGAEAQHVTAGSMALRVSPPIDAANDWALARISAPVCKGRALPISRRPDSEFVRLSAAQRIYQVAYHRDFGSWELVLGAPCAVRRSFGSAEWAVVAKDFVSAEQVILHTCDTGGASSGSPLLVDGPSGAEVVGINVGTYLQSRVLTQQGEVLHRYKSETVANTAVAGSAFRPALEALSRADILTDRRDLRALQTLLSSEGHYAGPRDGVYGAKLATAIRAFERAEGRGETGLATATLLKRLAARDAERRGRPAPPPTSRAREIETGNVGTHMLSGDRAKLPR